MIIKVWIVLAIISVVIQVFAANKCLSHYVGGIIPTIFLIFAVYTWHQLARIGMDIGTILAFFIPPVILWLVFELFYWRRRWLNRRES